MGILLGSIIVTIMVAMLIWYLLSPMFSKIGGFIEKKAKKFKKNWGGNKNE